MLRDHPHMGAAVQGLFVTFLWSTSWVLIKIGLDEIPALTFAGLRYILAFICLLPVASRSGHVASLHNMPRRTWGRLLLLGLLLYAMTQGAQFIALAYLPAITVNVLWSFSPVTVTLMGIALLDERPAWLQWFGVCVATFGAIIYFYPVRLPATQLFGVPIAILGVLANAGAAVLGRQVNRDAKLHPLIVTLVSMGIGAGVLLAAGVFFQGLPQLGRQSWLIIGWLAVVNTAFAFTLWNHTLRTLSAMESSIINGTMLIWIPILAVLFLGEQISKKELIGLVMAGVGTLSVQLRRPGIVLRLLRRFHL
jgi:drug/metabolite transporter (DMT)-like permease